MISTVFSVSTKLCMTSAKLIRRLQDSTNDKEQLAYLDTLVSDYNKIISELRFAKVKLLVSYSLADNSTINVADGQLRSLSLVHDESKKLNIK